MLRMSLSRIRKGKIGSKATGIDFSNKMETLVKRYNERNDDDVLPKYTKKW